MKSIEKDMEQWVEEFTKMKQQNPFDETIANALANAIANSNVAGTIEKNKKMTR